MTKKYHENLFLKSSEDALDLFLNRLDVADIFFLINFEPIQLQAYVLSVLKPETSAQILKKLPKNVWPDLLKRISQIKILTPEEKKEVLLILDEKFQSFSKKKLQKKGGLEKIIDVLQSLDLGSKEKILLNLSEKDFEFSKKIKEKIFSFEEIKNLDDDQIQSLLKDISHEIWKKALKKSTHEMKEKIFSFISERSKKSWIEDMEKKVLVSDIYESQNLILKKAHVFLMKNFKENLHD